MPPSWPNGKQSAWLHKWLRIVPHHPQLVRLQFEVHQFCKEYAKNPSSGRRLIIHGRNGCGKSHTAKAIWNWASSVRLLLPLSSSPNGPDDIQVSTAELILWPAIVDGFKRDRWQIIDDVVHSSLLVIDDIGAEHDPSGIGREKLYYILERRANKWTVLTTNIPAADWPEKFENRIASRFLRNCTAIDLSDVPDYCAI